MLIKLEHIIGARESLSPYIKCTPLLRSENLDEVLNCRVHFKPENLQVTGSFKARGAANKLLSLTKEEISRGVITASSGNHAQGVAYAGKILGINTTVILPEDVAEIKLEGCKSFGAEIIKHGKSSAERRARAEEIKNERGLTSIHSYDDLSVIAGQGTIGLEILDSLNDADCVVVPVGGGGLISGVAAAIKEKGAKTRIIGVETAAIPRYTVSLKEGKPATVMIQDTCADALKAVKAGVMNFELIKKYVDEIVTVEDNFIVKAFELIVINTKLLAEISSCIVVGAALNGKIKFNEDEKVVFLLSGGNIDRRDIVKYFNQ